MSDIMEVINIRDVISCLCICLSQIVLSLALNIWTQDQNIFFRFKVPNKDEACVKCRCSYFVITVTRYLLRQHLEMQKWSGDRLWSRLYYTLPNQSHFTRRLSTMFTYILNGQNTLLLSNWPTGHAMKHYTMFSVPCLPILYVHLSFRLSLAFLEPLSLFL